MVRPKVLIVVRLTPKSAKDAIEGWGQDEQGRNFLKVRVRAAPIEGKANAAMLALLAKALDLPKSRLNLMNGDTSRLKQVEIDGLSQTQLKEKIHV